MRVHKASPAERVLSEVLMSVELVPDAVRVWSLALIAADFSGAGVGAGARRIASVVKALVDRSQGDWNREE